LINCTSLKVLYLNSDPDEEDTKFHQSTLRNFRIASMLGTFTNLQKLILSSTNFGNHMTFYPDFIDAINTKGFKNLKSLKLNIPFQNANDDTINLFIESLSKYCQELEYLIFFGNLLQKHVKHVIQVCYSYCSIYFFIHYYYYYHFYYYHYYYY